MEAAWRLASQTRLVDSFSTSVEYFSFPALIQSQHQRPPRQSHPQGERSYAAHCPSSKADWHSSCDASRSDDLPRLRSPVEIELPGFRRVERRSWVRELIV